MENPCSGHAGHVRLHGRVCGVSGASGQAADRLLRMGSLPYEADPCLDEYDVLGAEGGTGGGHRQVHAEVPIWVQGAVKEVVTQLQAGAEESTDGERAGKEV